MAFASSGGDEAFLVDLKKSYAADMAELQKLLAAFEEKLADVRRRIQEFAYNKNNLDDLASKVDRAKAKLNSLEEPVCLLRDKVFDQIRRLFEKDASSMGYQARVVVLDHKFSSVLGDVKCLIA